MISELVRTLKQMVNPFVYLPMIVVAIVAIFLEAITNNYLNDMLMDLALYSEFVTIDIVAILFTYWPTILILICASIISFFTIIVASIIVARIAKGQGILKAVNDSMMEFSKSFYAAIYILVILFLFVIVGGTLNVGLDFIYSLAPSEQLLNLISLVIAPLLFFVLGLAILIKTIFTIPALTEGNIKEAIGKSFSFTNNKLIKSIVFMGLVVIVYSIINYIALLLSSLVTVGGLDLLTYSIIEIIGNTFFVLAISNYYF
ncbi:MAG: hypothetical protein PHQ98_03940, partial [Candidatus ainarchaeum sp.]|nr:hypothetical protein [Candidatus ainarchaeum sp.]